MVASTDIKFYVHTNNNAPQLQNAYGSMINVLDACLVNGIDIGTISSITASGATVTALFSSAHNLMQYQVIKITGAVQSEFNGEHRISTVPNAQSVTFELAAAPSVSTATGTINASLPPLEWEKPFSSSNPGGGGKGAYRSKNPLLPSRPFLRVVDELDPVWTSTYAKYAKVGLVEDMTDIDTMLGVQAPYDASLPGKNWVGSGSGTTAYNGWAKWYYARFTVPGVNSSQYDTSAPANGVRNWMIIGTKDTFYVMNSVHHATQNLVLSGFGAFESLYAVDTAANFISSSGYYATAATASQPQQFTGIVSTFTSHTATNFSLCLQRKYDGAAMSTQAKVSGLAGLTQDMFSGTADVLTAAPSAYIFTPVPVYDFSSTYTVARGKLPLVHWLYNNKPYSDNFVFSEDGVLYMSKTVVTSGSTTGQVLFKIGEL